MITHWSFELPEGESGYVEFGEVAAFTFKIKNKTYSLAVDKIFCSSKGCVLSSNAGSIRVYGSRIVDVSFDEKDRQCVWEEDAEATNQERWFYRSSLSSREDLISYLDKYFDEWTCWLPVDEFDFILRRKDKESDIEITSQELQWGPAEKTQEENKMNDTAGPDLSILGYKETSNQELSKINLASTSTNSSNTKAKRIRAGIYFFSGIALETVCLFFLLMGLFMVIPALSISSGIGLLVGLVFLCYGTSLYDKEASR